MAYRIRSHFICALVAALVLLCHPVKAQDRAGEVAEILQSGLQIHGGRVGFLQQGDAVVQNARLETDGVGEMALAMDDGTRLTMMSDSEVVIDRFVYDPDRSVGGAVLSLGRGALRMISGRMASDRYQVNTPVATIGLRGTDFTVELVPGTGLLIRVDEGAVVIRPTDSEEQFTVNQGQTSLCSETECEDVAPDDQPLRRARLEVPSSGGPGQGTAGGQGQAVLRQASASAATGSTRIHAAAGAEHACAPYRIPDSAYRRIGLDPGQWPGTVEGITMYRHAPEGLLTKHYCPHQIKFAGNKTSFTVQGQAGPGDTRVLYFANTLSGQGFFQPGFNRRAKEKGDAKAYENYMARIFEDEPGYRVVKSTAAMQRPAPDQYVLQQRVRARVPGGEYLVTGLTLFRPASGNRMGLFTIPAVVTPRQSDTALTAMDIGRSAFAQLPDAVVVEGGAQ